MSLFTQWVPHEWSEEPQRRTRGLRGPCDRRPQRAGAESQRAILHRQVLGPYDMEQEIGLIEGNIFHGELSAEQLLHMRPAPGHANYRTPIRGLYQASSATHAGGGVCAIPAYNCVRRYGATGAGAPEGTPDRAQPRITRWRRTAPARHAGSVRPAMVGAFPEVRHARQLHEADRHRWLLRRDAAGQPQVR